MNSVYVDSSTLVSLAAGSSKRSVEAQAFLKEIERLFTSELSRIECLTGIYSQFKSGTDRSDAEENLNEILSQFELIAVVREVVDEAGILIRKYRTSLGLRSLDAVHVATANYLRVAMGEISKANLSFLTSDDRQRRVFVAEGYLGKFL